MQGWQISVCGRFLFIICFPVQPVFICVRKKSLAGMVRALLRTAALWWGHAGCLGNNAIPEWMSKQADFSVLTVSFLLTAATTAKFSRHFIAATIEEKKEEEHAQLQFSKSFIFIRLGRSWQTQKRTMHRAPHRAFHRNARETMKSFTFDRCVGSGGVPLCFHRPAGCRRSASNIRPHLCFTESKGCGAHTHGASRCKGMFAIYRLLPLTHTCVYTLRHAHDWINTNLHSILLQFGFF